MKTTTPRPAVEAPQEERYVIGRTGVFATLWDRQEKRLVVDNATEEHCCRVRAGLIEQNHAVDPADAAFARLAVEHPECCSTAADYPDWTCGGVS
ncbi:hypothetical protein [Streptomyces sp. NPDC059788]|uniref:hypothetical protein n=1 Tax=Streptomyces sp. NPDC059788 TaxID=3346948 RepID=UPI003669F52F